MLTKSSIPDQHGDLGQRPPLILIPAVDRHDRVPNAWGPKPTTYRGHSDGPRVIRPPRAPEPSFPAISGTDAQVPGQPERRALGWRWSERLAFAAELVGDAGEVDAVLRQHPSVLGVAGVDLVWQLAGGLARAQDSISKRTVARSVSARNSISPASRWPSRVASRKAAVSRRSARHLPESWRSRRSQGSLGRSRHRPFRCR
jgi:hypothetical protein